MTEIEAQERIRELRFRLEALKMRIVGQLRPGVPQMPIGEQYGESIQAAAGLQPAESPIPALGQYVQQAGQKLFPEYQPPSEGLQGRYAAARVPKVSEAMGGKFGQELAGGAGRLLFGVGSWYADLVSAPHKAVNDLMSGIKSGVYKWDDLRKALLGDEKLRQELKTAIATHPVETVGEFFMPIGALLGLRGLGRFMAGKLGVRPTRGGVWETGGGETYDTQTQGRVLRGEPFREEPRRPVQVGERGPQAAEAGGGTQEVKAREQYRQRLGQEQSAEAILDGLDIANVNLNELQKSFWDKVFPTLERSIQKRFENWVESRLGPNPIHPGETWAEVTNRFIPLDEVQNLVGSERGYVALMAEALRRFQRNADKVGSPFGGRPQAPQVTGYVAPVEMTGGLGVIGTAVPKYVAAKARAVGQKLNQVRHELLTSAGKRGASPAYKNLWDSLRRVEKAAGPIEGKMHEMLNQAGIWSLGRLWRNKSKELGSALLEEQMPTDPALRLVVPRFRNAMGNIFQMIRQAGVQVLDKDGNLKLIEPLQNYFPRMLKESVAKDLAATADKMIKTAEVGPEIAEMGKLSQDVLIKRLDDMIAQKQIDIHSDFMKAVNHMLERGVAKSPGDAAYKIHDYATNDLYRPFGNIERSRILDFPLDFYETDVQVVLEKYINNAARVISEVQEYGPDRGKLTELLKTVVEQSPDEAVVAKQMTSQFMGTADKLSPGLQSAVDKWVNFQVATKIGLGTATIPNTTQLLISTMPKFGVISTIKGIGQLAKPSVRQYLREAGVAQQDFFRLFYDVDPQTASVTRAAAKVTTKLSGFNTINKFNRFVTGSVARLKVPDLHRWANQAADNFFAKRRQAYARSTLEKFGIEWDKPLTDKALSEAVYRIANDLQLTRSVLTEPLWMTSPKWKMFGLFKRFGYKQLKFTKDQILAEAKNNPLPLLRLLIGAGIAGEAVHRLKDLLKETVTGRKYEEPELKAELMPLIERYAWNLAAAGSFGVASEFFDAVQRMPYEGEPESVNAEVGRILDEAINTTQFVTSPVILSDAIRLSEMGRGFAGRMKAGYSPGEAFRFQAKNLGYMLGSIPGYFTRRLTDKANARAMVLHNLKKGNKGTAKRIAREWLKDHGEPLF